MLAGWGQDQDEDTAWGEVRADVQMAGEEAAEGWAEVGAGRGEDEERGLR